MVRHVVFVTAILLPLLASSGFAYDETYEKAVRHFKGKEYRNAVPYLEKYVSRNPDPAGYYMLGYALYQLGNYEKAREYFDQAYLIDPDFSSEKVPAHAGLSNENERLVHDVLALSDAKKQMDYYRRIVSGSVPGVQRAMSKEKTSQDLSAMVGASFEQSRLYSSGVGVFSSRFNRTHITAVIQWLKSPLGRKLAGIDVGGYTPEELQRSPELADLHAKLPEERRRVIRNLEAAICTTDLNISIISQSLFEMLRGMQSQMGERSPLGSAEIEALVENIREMPREELTSQVLISLSHMYRNFTEEEITEVIRFYATPAGRWYSETSRDAIRTAIGKAARESGEKIGRTLILRRFAV
jgi:hypothetical protein